MSQPAGQWEVLVNATAYTALTRTLAIDVAFLEAGGSVTVTFDAVVKVATPVANCAAVAGGASGDSDAGDDEDCITIVPREQYTFWQNTNREAGTVSALAFSPEQYFGKTGGVADGTLFAGTDGGGLHRTTDGGDNWFPVDPAQLGDAYIRDLVRSRSAIVLDEIARRDAIDVTDDDIEGELERYAEQTGHTVPRW